VEPRQRHHVLIFTAATPFTAALHVVQSGGIREGWTNKNWAIAQFLFDPFVFLGRSIPYGLCFVFVLF
jgi:hypothetical protein